MRFLQLNFTMKASCSLYVAGFMGFLALSNAAQAVVLVTFSQSGNDVIATLSGSLLLPQDSDRNLDDSLGALDASGTINSLYYLFSSPATYDEYTNGQSFASGLSQTPNSFSGSVGFGYALEYVLVEGSSSPGDTITPTGTWTWNNTTLAAIGLGSLTTTPVIVHRLAPSSDDTIQFVSTVPEPSSSVLLGLGATALVFRRRRLP